MPRVDVEGYGVFEVPEGTRLVRALEANGVDVLHRCGGYARCTTCRVAFIDGEPRTMTEAEYARLSPKGLIGKLRLSCQIVVDRDMSVRPLVTLQESDMDNPGPTPEEQITPPPLWISLEGRDAAKLAS